MAYTREELIYVFSKGIVDPRYDSTVFRKDRFGRWMELGRYGERDHDFGWEVDHLDPNGGDRWANLVPLNWRSNCEKSDKRI
jgi:hypothetical protein